MSLEKAQIAAAKIGYEVLSTEYISSDSKMLFKCNKGHIFEKRWNAVQSGKRCQFCTEYGFDFSKPANLYYARLKSRIGIFYKLGVTNGIISRRLKNVPYKTTLLWHKTYLFGKYAVEEEQRLFNKYDRFRYRGEELGKFGGFTELFVKDVLNKDDTGNMRSLLLYPYNL